MRLPKTLPKPDYVLMFMTLLWGGTFIITRNALTLINPLFFIAARFGVAAFLLVTLLRPNLFSLRKRDIAAGLIIGLTLFFGYGLQAIGLRTIASAQSSFLTALYVPMVPLIEFLAFRRRPQPIAALGIATAFLGLILVSGQNLHHLTINIGEILTLGGALAAAIEIVLISRLAKGTDPRRMALVELITVSLLALTTGFLLRLPHPPSQLPTITPTGLALSILVMGMATAFIMVAQNWAQSLVSANRATIIYTMEPVWAALIGATFGESFRAAQILGAALIIASVALSQWRSSAPAEPITPH
jgi:drug/metabolite transporter (DMT)-like permease